MTISKIVTFHGKTYTNGFPFSNGIPFTSRLKAVRKKRTASGTHSNDQWNPFVTRSVAVRFTRLTESR